ncbi:hypothetical protein RFI_04831 [Reticulomyxa filosa]|uniref:Uncharacterized protein n=1 Tax=Reticulomyxa filosa TaxID=46433 RepID=X6P241_RETFI|nr:hypothetical protein RFI_04831 [Reticulomyxa filosa]|eukprot:ETO32286.1 hypothetical protein RFI_04831 [Reticulomyxa filosa]
MFFAYTFENKYFFKRKCYMSEFFIGTAKKIENSGFRLFGRETCVYVLNSEGFSKHSYHAHQAAHWAEKDDHLCEAKRNISNSSVQRSETDPLLVWNDFQERYELRNKRILSEKTKKILLSMHRRFPQKWNKETMIKTFGLFMETIDFIFWEDEMRRKYKITYDLDTIKLLPAGAMACWNR